MTKMRKTMAGTFSVLALATAFAPVAAAQSREAGNGGGASGQCTGPQDERPASCQSRGGPGDQGSN